jgi:lipopolysaccharide transport system ATP-binding protein
MWVTATHLSKRYQLKGHAPRTFQQALIQLGKGLRGSPFWALRDVSFKVKPGEAVAVVGANGAGKSTLLRLLCGLGRPTSGQVHVNGRAAAVLGLGVGFHPQLTGRENLYVNAIVSGLTRWEVNDIAQRIIEFAEIGAFIDEPLRTYSAGMQMRLAFSVATHVDPDVLIIDEALAVGDAYFQAKCAQRLDRFRQQGKTLIIVSHQVEALRGMCQRALWLHEGRLRADGPLEAVCARYESHCGAPTPSHETPAVRLVSARR